MLAFVGLVVGTTAALTLFAYRASLQSLEADARGSVRAAADERSAALARLLNSRQQRAEGFLAAAESLCGEPVGRGRFGWSLDCVGTLMQEFRQTERARGVTLLYGSRALVRSGSQVEMTPPLPGAVARLVWREDGAPPEYIMQATRGYAQLWLQFDNSEVQPLFDDRSGLGQQGEVFLTDSTGRFITSPRFAAPADNPAPVREQLASCSADRRELVENDYRGVRTFHGLAPAPAIGGGCIDAHIAYAEALAPAETMRADLVARGAAFAVAGALLSLFAAHWISDPVRKLMLASRAIQAGQFRRQIPVSGPTEVRELGHAFSSMAEALDWLITSEQGARREAEHANRSKDEFLATVSHELRTPLTAILGWSRLMRDGRLSPTAAARAIAAIERNAQVQRRLIDDLLDVSRIVRGELKFEQEVVPLAAAADAALDAVNPQAAEKGVVIVRRIDPMPVHVLGDAQRLQQVVWNLVLNAVKFTPTGGQVTVELRRNDREAELVVTDTGVGIAPEFLPHAFDWFRQGDAASTRSQSGLGLGLGLVKQIVELHGGQVRAESAGAGCGATFVVSLPLHQTLASVPARPARPTLAVSDLTDVRVLVVDDDVETVEAVRAVLEHAGADVGTAANAAAARREVETWHPDVLISDIAMPYEDGYSLIKSLRDADVQVAAIALTAHARREDEEQALAAGFQIHLSKPVDPSELVDTVASLAFGGRAA
jgi:signal transduction histidine kinase